jgi:bile acid:Na+ symporter, BASS family
MSQVRGVFAVSLAVTIVVTVFSLGIGLRVEQLLAVLRRTRLLAVAALLNLFVVPAFAWLVAWLLPLSPAQRVAVVLVAAGAGGAAGLKAVQLSRRGDAALAVGLVVLLELLDLVSVPLWAGSLVEGGTIRPAEVLVRLVALVLLPLCLGVWLGSATTRLAASLMPWLIRLGTLGLVVTLVAGTVSAEGLSSLLRSWVPVAALLTCLAGLAVGYLTPKTDVPTRVTLSIVTGTRFSALGLLVVATALHNDPRYQSAAILAALVNLAVASTVALLLRRAPRGKPRSTGASATATSPLPAEN